MSEWGCGHKPQDQDACGKPASWFGTFFIGAWRSHVPLCDEHVRAFALMGEALSKAREVSGLPEGTPMAFAVRCELANEIYSMEDPLGRKFELSRQVWSCSECGLPIVRSLESGRWILAGDTSETAKVSLALHPHEHTPG